MRNQKAVDLGAERGVAVVWELRTRDMRRILERMARTPDILEILRDGLPEVLTLAEDAVTLPADLPLAEVSLSEWDALLAAWLELNQRFFPLAAVLTRGPAAADPTLSTAPVCSSSSAGTAASGSTDGRAI